MYNRLAIYALNFLIKRFVRFKQSCDKILSLIFRKQLCKLLNRRFAFFSRILMNSELLNYFSFSTIACQSKCISSRDKLYESICISLVEGYKKLYGYRIFILFETSHIQTFLETSQCDESISNLMFIKS